VHDAALPTGFRKVLLSTLDQTQASVRDDQFGAGEIALLEVGQEP